MKQKTITFLLTIIAVLAPLLIIPSADDSNYNILKLIVLLSAGLILLMLLLASYKTLSIDKKDIVILIFMTLVLLSTIFSSNIKISILGEENRYEGTLMFAVYIIIYFCAKKYFKYEKISIFINVMFVVSMVIGILGIAQQYISNLNLYPIFDKGICSTFGNSNFFGSYISIVLPISAVAFIFSGSKKGLLLSLVMFFNMVSSGTRSAWVAFMVVGLLGLIYLIKQKNKKYFIRAGILLLLFVIIFIYLLIGFDFIMGKSNKVNYTKMKLKQIKQEMIQAKETKNFNRLGSTRIFIWKMSLKLMVKKPIFGCGPDNLWYGFLQYCPEEVAWFGMIIDKAHNEYLHIGATLGIPALITYITFISSILIPKIKLAIKNKIYFCICLSIISYLVQAIFNISTIGIAPLFWMILGLIDNEELINKIKKTIDIQKQKVVQ